jgi:transcriptional regulator with XRE-family HTH domain
MVDFSKEMIGKELKTMRKKHGLKQNVIAASMGVKPSQYQKWESGKVMMGADKMLKFYDALDLKVGYLVPGDDFLFKLFGFFKEKENTKD